MNPYRQVQFFCHGEMALGKRIGELISGVLKREFTDYADSFLLRPGSN